MADWGAAFAEQIRKEMEEDGEVPAVAAPIAQTPIRTSSAPRHAFKNSAFSAGVVRASAPPSFIAPGGPKMDAPSSDKKSPEPVVDKPMSPEEIALLNKFVHKKILMMRNEVVDIKSMHHDSTSPLFSTESFEEMRLREPLLKALSVLNFHQPSRIQEFALPMLLMEPPTNLIAQSQSGTGKTAAFVLAMLSRVELSEKNVQCVCLSPTYELAMQIGEVVKSIGQFMEGLSVHYAVKGSRINRGATVTDQIVIGTPGKMIDYITKFNAFDTKKVKCLVLDEADVMISQQGHQDLSIRIYRQIEGASPSVQTMLFSATYDPPVIHFANNLIKNAVSVTLRRDEQALPNIKQYYVECLNRDAKYEAVVNLYSGLTIASAIIFCHTKHSASWLATKMREKGHEVALLHGDLTVEERAKAIRDFKDGVYKVLITTNVCARGIDVEQVTLVINYDPPVHYDTPCEPDYETYLHRIGRTGRFGKKGMAINFVDSLDVLHIIKKIEAHFEKEIVKLDPADMEQLEGMEKD